ncbi:MAG: hypothetical protein JSS07_06430 [Proteobacteria bacterium]|nr:hypothetical protein [Pseudomonadota bacterium]
MKTRQLANTIKEMIICFKDSMKNRIISVAQSTLRFIKELPQNFLRFLQFIGSCFHQGIALGKMLFNWSIHFIQNLPRYIVNFFQGLWDLLKFSIDFVKKLGKHLFKVAKYIVTHFGEIIKNLYDAIVFIIKKMPTIARFLFDLARKTLTFILDNSLKIVRFCITQLPNMIKNLFIFIIALGYVAVELGIDAFNWGTGRSNQTTLPESTSSLPPMQQSSSNATNSIAIEELSRSISPQYHRTRTQINAAEPSWQEEISPSLRQNQPGV